MRRDQIAAFDWMRVIRTLGIGLFVISVALMFSGIFGMAGHMIMALFDSAFGAQLSPLAPWVPWAIAGALIGAGPALWSFGAFRKRRLAVLLVPLGTILVIGIISTILLETIPRGR